MAVRGGFRAPYVMILIVPHYHCEIYQDALAGEVVDFSHVITLEIKLINSIRALALRHRGATADWITETYFFMLSAAAIR